MTAKEAKHFLKEFLGDKPNFREERPGYTEEVYHQMDMLAEAIDMAISALEGKDTDVPSKDTISRQDVLGWLLAYHTKSFDLKGRYYPHEVIGWLVADISKNLFADMRGEQDDR